MIRIFLVVSMSLLFLLLLSSPVLFMPGDALAACCGATCKKWLCTCRGTYPCVYDPGDADALQSNAVTIGGSSQKDIARDTSVLTAATSDLIESFLELTTAGKCFREKLALSSLGDARDNLKFVNFATFLLDADTAK